MLEIVEHQQRGAILASDTRARRQIAGGDVRQAERLCDGPRDKSRITNSGQRYKHHSNRAFVRHRADKLQRQTALPRSAWSGDRHQPHGVIREPLPQNLHVSFAADQSGRSRRERHAGQLLDGRVWSTCPCACQECVTGRIRQIKSCRQRTHGLDLGPPSFAALERAHGMDRQPRNRRELLLSETGSLAERLELTAE